MLLTWYDLIFCCIHTFFLLSVQINPGRPFGQENSPQSSIMWLDWPVWNWVSEGREVLLNTPTTQDVLIRYSSISAGPVFTAPQNRHPDRTFHSFGAFKPGDWRALRSSETPFDGLWCPEIVKCSVGTIDPLAAAASATISLSPCVYLTEGFVSKSRRSTHFMKFPIVYRRILKLSKLKCSVWTSLTVT